MVINKFPNREVYEKIKAKGSLGADDVNVLEDYPGPELPASAAADAGKLLQVGADGNAAWGDKMPTALKNPNALTFTGAATGTYDGSAPLTVNIPAGGASGSGGALKAMSAVNGYIGIPAADLPENGVVWMCFGSGNSTELYTGTVTIQDAGIAVNDMLMITNGTVNPLDQVSLVSDGLAVYGLSESDYRGVYQVVRAGCAAEATQKAWAKIIDAEITEATMSFSKNGLPNVTELYIKGSQLANATDKDSAQWLIINNKTVSTKITNVSKVNGSKVFNWTYCKYNGLVWEIYSSDAAISNKNFKHVSRKLPLQSGRQRWGGDID